MDEKRKNEKSNSTLRKRISSLVMALAIIIGLNYEEIYQYYLDRQFLENARIDEDTSKVYEINDYYFNRLFKRGGMDLNRDGKFSEYEAQVYLEKEMIRNEDREKGMGWIIKGAESLEGFQVFKDIEYISLMDSSINSIEPLANLPALKRLSIYDANITDVEPVTHMKSLEKLNLSGNKIEDLNPLLEYFDHKIDYNFEKNPFDSNNSDKVILGYLPDSSRYYPAFESRSNIDEEKLNASENIEFEKMLKEKLLSLGIDINNDGEINIYEANRIRGELNLSGSELTDISGIRHFTGIKSLNISNDLTREDQYNKIKDISEVFELKQLVWLNAAKNEVELIVDATEMGNLEILDLGANQLTTIETLPMCPKLKELNVSVNKIESLKGVEQFTELKELSAKYCNLSSFEEILTLDKLTDLRLSNNNIKVIDGISRLENLELVYISDNEIQDISELLELKDLWSLSVNHNPLYDYKTDNSELIGEISGQRIYRLKD